MLLTMSSSSKHQVPRNLVQFRYPFPWGAVGVSVGLSGS